MKHSRGRYEPPARTIPGSWLEGSPASPGREAYKWITTLPVPLAAVRECALKALTEIHAALAYLYETDEKVVVRSTLPQRQLRAELKRLDAGSTRIVVVTMRGSEVDRRTSGAVVEAIEQKLQEAGHLPGE